MLAAKTGKGNLEYFFDLQHGFGNRTRNSCMFFLCMLVLIYLSLLETTNSSERLTKMKYKLSDDNITMENPGADDTSSMESVDLIGV